MNGCYGTAGLSESLPAEDSVDREFHDGQLEAALIAFPLARFLECGAFRRGQTFRPVFVDLRQDGIDFGVEFLGNGRWVVDSQ